MSEDETHVTPVIFYKYTYEDSDRQSHPSLESKESVRSQISGQVFFFLLKKKKVNVS